MRMRGRVCMLLVVFATTTLQAQEGTVIYRCTNASGALTIQNGTPCPKGSKQEKRMVEAPTMVPSYPTPAATAAPPALTTTPPQAGLSTGETTPRTERPQIPAASNVADAERLPPPPLFQCNTWDNDHFLSEDGAPQPRCVRLQTTDLSGDPNAGAGQACEMKTDQCQRVPDGAACEGWKQRQREVESTWRYARGDDKQRWQDEFARVTRILTESTCGK